MGSRFSRNSSDGEETLAAGSRNRIEEKLPTVKINALTLSGRCVEVEISPSDSVQTLKELVAPLLELPPRQLRLAFKETVLGQGPLQRYGITADAEVSVVVMPALPDYADEFGLDIDHISNLHSFCERHSFKDAKYLESEATHWEVFSQMVNDLKRSEHDRHSWTGRLQLTKGEQLTTLHAKPGEKITIEMEGRVWNRNADSCIHQLLVLLDKEIVAEVYNGVPSSGRDVRMTKVIAAPSQPGVYMFWKNTQLQYTMQAARNNAQNFANGTSIPAQYPAAFLGWLVVEG